MKNLVLAAAISTLPAALYAQDGTSDSPDKAPEIIVTAAAVAKLDGPLAETPQNITVITELVFDQTYFTGGDFRAVFFGERRQVQLTLSAGF